MEEQHKPSAKDIADIEREARIKEAKECLRLARSVHGKSRYGVVWNLEERILRLEDGRAK